MKRIGGRPHSATAEEFAEQEKLARLLSRHLDPETTFWTSLECKPRSRVSGLFQRRRGVRSGIPDVMIVFYGRLIFIEMKSRCGFASKTQKQVRAELLKAGAATWWMVRSASAGLMALRKEGVVFRREWKPPQLQSWEGPFADPTQPLPQAPEAIAQRRAAVKRWRERQRARVAARRANVVALRGGTSTGRPGARGGAWTG